MLLFRLLITFVMVGLLTAATSVDRPAPASPVVYACGSHYVKSVPSGAYDYIKGETSIYAVGSEGDELLHTFPWYSPRLELRRFGRDLSMVRFGGWPVGREASDDVLAIGFYLNDKELQTYSTLDLAGRPENVNATVSHHIVIAEVHGYRIRHTADGKSVEYLFELTTIDGRLLSFDCMTGELRDASDVGKLLQRGDSITVNLDGDSHPKNDK